MTTPEQLITRLKQQISDKTQDIASLDINDLDTLFSTISSVVSNVKQKLNTLNYATTQTENEQVESDSSEQAFYNNWKDKIEEEINQEIGSLERLFNPDIPQLETLNNELTRKISSVKQTLSDLDSNFKYRVLDLLEFTVEQATTIKENITENLTTIDNNIKELFNFE